METIYLHFSQVVVSPESHKKRSPKVALLKNKCSVFTITTTKNHVNQP